jgi:hypothetical protein
MTNYLKEKETRLEKELRLQKAMCLQKEGDATSTHERINSLQEEIENYKSLNETLKKEILDQERDLKCQIGTFEKKAHDNWVAACQAERELEESKQEASQLRKRQIIVKKNVIKTLSLVRLQRGIAECQRTVMGCSQPRLSIWASLICATNFMMGCLLLPFLHCCQANHFPQDP